MQKKRRTFTPQQKAEIALKALSNEDSIAALCRQYNLSSEQISHWKAELCNVVWNAVRLGRMAPEQIDDLLGLAAALPIASVDVAELWRGAIARAVNGNHPAYDTLFVELAARLDTRVVSYDRQMKTRFPSLVMRPADALKVTSI